MSVATGAQCFSHPQTAITLLIGSFTGSVVHMAYLAETDVLNQRPIILASIFWVSGFIGLMISQQLHDTTGVHYGTEWSSGLTKSLPIAPPGARLCPHCGIALRAK